MKAGLIKRCPGHLRACRKTDERVATAIAGFEVELTSLEGKMKMLQNMSAADIAGVIAGLENRANPAGISVADAMRRYVQGGK